MHRLLLLVVLAAACSDDGVRHTPDAAPHDGPGSPDASADAGPTPVTLTATAGGTPMMGVHVYFIDVDGSVVRATTTDATGTASASMAPGGSVTALDPYAPPGSGQANDEIDTFFGVQPGDHLRLDLAGVATTSINVTVIADADPAASSLWVYTPCGYDQLQQAGVAGLAAPRVTMALANCGATTDFLLVSYDQSSQPLNFFYVPATAISDGATVDFVGTPYAAAPTRSFNYTNASQLSVYIQDHLLDAQGDVFDWNANAGSGSGGYPMPAFPNATDVMISRMLAGGASQQVFVDWGPYASTYTTDVGARLLPLWSGQPTFDPSNATLSVGEQPGGVTPDFAMMSVNAHRQSDGRRWTWRVASPNTDIIRFPTLPTDVYDYNITAADQPSMNEILLGKVSGGWDAVRPSLLSNSGLPPQGFVTGSAGSVTLEQYVFLATAPRVLGHRLR